MTTHTSQTISGAVFVKTKTAVIGSLVWLVLVVGLLLLVLYFQWENRSVPRSRFNDHAESLGRIAGILVGVGWGGLWIPWFSRRKQPPH